MPTARSPGAPTVGDLARGAILALAAVAAGLLAIGCSPPSPLPEPSNRVADADWSRLEEARSGLVEQRKQLAGQVARAPSAPTTAELRRAVERRSDELSRRLVAFLNQDPPREQEPLAPRQAQAIRWKSELDIYLARGYVERAGDYRRALDILEAALALDPGHAELRAELAAVRAARFVTAESFAKIKDGMSPDQVRAILGAPNPHNVREYLEQGPGRGVTGWFYPKDDLGRAAGVWFAKDRGQLIVYRADFSAVQPEGASRPAPAAGRPTASPPVELEAPTGARP